MEVIKVLVFMQVVVVGEEDVVGLEVVIDDREVRIITTIVTVLLFGLPLLLHP